MNLIKITKAVTVCYTDNFYLSICCLKNIIANLCVISGLVPLRGVNEFEATPTQFLGVSSKISDEHPCHFHRGVLPRGDKSSRSPVVDRGEASSPKPDHCSKRVIVVRSVHISLWVG